MTDFFKELDKLFKFLSNTNEFIESMGYEPPVSTFFMNFADGIFKSAIENSEKRDEIKSEFRKRFDKHGESVIESIRNRHYPPFAIGLNELFPEIPESITDAIAKVVTYDVVDDEILNDLIIAVNRLAKLST